MAVFSSTLEHRSMLRRLKVEADDVGGFLLELRIVGGHVAVQLMRLQTQLRPHPLHGGFTDPQCCCHLAAGPMRGLIDWLALRFPCDAGLQSSIGDAWFTALMKRIEANRCRPARNVASNAKSSVLSSAT